ncbi:unnamed protein product [Bursaphelenchus xylophilus]|uniref:Hexosyltransferase n=1 Tax=Bursaphelenchus xylophilus TaxID=6326 RepID=A0A811JYF7_BURXY|nr:unnamed protein product [Bursaphelenchus xylophilus]CAG9082130.1 unnamed protein product [Bursaphelenchus xylophilus]
MMHINTSSKVASFFHGKSRYFIRILWVVAAVASTCILFRASLPPLHPPNITALLPSSETIPRKNMTELLDVNDIPPSEGRKVPVVAKFKDQSVSYSLIAPLEEEFCRHTNVLILVISRPDGFRNRKAMRDSWIYYEDNPKNVTVKFLIGRTNNTKVNLGLEEETQSFMDIVRYDYTDKYELLPLKVHAAFAFKEEFCPSAKYFMKTDDDTVVDLNRMNHFIETNYNEKYLKTPKMFLCSVYSGMKPHRDKGSKYYVPPSLYEPEDYPSFCQGCTYMASSDGIRAVLEKTAETNFLYLEDVLFTGIVAESANVTRYDTLNYGHYVCLQGDTASATLSFFVNFPHILGMGH